MRNFSTPLYKYKTIIPISRPCVSIVVGRSELTNSVRNGKNGIKAVNEKYNWAIEEKKLFKLYDELLGAKV